MMNWMLAAFFSVTILSWSLMSEPAELPAVSINILSITDRGDARAEITRENIEWLVNTLNAEFKNLKGERLVPEQRDGDDGRESGVAG